jgi:hypothetical protein
MSYDGIDFPLGHLWKARQSHDLVRQVLSKTGIICEYESELALGRKPIENASWDVIAEQILP